MKVVLTVIARDEIDIVDAQIAFHLAAGVDFVIAVDNGSTDGTAEALEAHAREGHLHLIRDEGDMRQGEWVTRLARLAATEFGADWVVNSDVDGFWWPRDASLKDVFAAVPPRYGCVRAMVRHFAPRPDTHPFFAERMTVRVCTPGMESNSPWSPCYQTAHRGVPDVVVNYGNHHAQGRGLVPLEGWYPIDMLHFPIRSLAQCERKLLQRWELETRAGRGPGSMREAAYEAHQAGRMRSFYESWVVSDDALEHGVAEGTLALDTRLRDALRRLRSGGPDDRWDFALPPSAPELEFGGSIDEGYLTELAILERGWNPLVRAQERAEALERRLEAVEASPWSRALAKVTARGSGR